MVGRNSKHAVCKVLQILVLNHLHIRKYLVGHKMHSTCNINGRVGF